MSKLRVLCLHGFTSNGSVHAHQVRHLTSALSSTHEFLFPDGPHTIPITPEKTQSNPQTKIWSDFVSAHSTSGHRAWWIARDPNPQTNDPGGFHGLEKSLDFIGDLLKKEGPVHAIWGFSQGACFAGMLMALLSPELREHPLRKGLGSEQGMPMAGVFFSGFKARFEMYDTCYESGIAVPTLHVVGQRDEAVTPERSETLIRICGNATVLRHAGGHEIPAKEQERERIVRFLRENVTVGKGDERGKM